jgi:deazaflavin-dependent oxidoreductase (nitroreductase family)
MVIVASLAGYDRHPAWYLNLKADRNCQVQLDRRKMSAVAHDADENEREQLWPKLTALLPLWDHFQKQTDRQFPIVILSPTGAA